ncbi:hypoxanthine phosphoribosyltransferase [Desulfonatronospira sp.]|uniref:hypoxanthine phosphoribosyltransferase n=1 Tax=Desulfonatronospira sp. TaxID=1962951 RepID=UPI0025B7B293|nr:hypoxanthine phosphoribosyltransferase [Desulfonatronospira sp.]
MQLREIYTPDQIAHRVQEIGRDISRRYAGEKLLGVCILKGAFIFFADLIRNLDLDLDIDFVRLSSYADQTTSSGEVVITGDLEYDVRDKNILVVEDIVDTGLSLYYFKDILRSRGAGSIEICALIDKHERRQVQVNVDYCGFRVQEGFLVGYGLDMSQKFRNLPGIYAVNAPGEDPETGSSHV